MRRFSPIQSGAAGVVAAVAAFALAFLLRLSIRAAFLPEISAQLVIEYSPGDVAQFIIEHFGKGGKVGGTAISLFVYFVAAAFFAALFVALRPRLPSRNALLKGVTFGVIPLLVSAVFLAAILWFQPSILAGYSISTTILSLLLMNLIFGGVLGLLSDSGAPEESTTAVARALATRRGLFAACAAVLAATFGGITLRKLFGPLLQASGSPSGQLPPFYTPNSEFYEVSKDVSSPVVDEQQWVLSIGGHVEHPYKISYGELLRMPMTEQDVTLECVSNEIGGPLISNARWRGIPLHVFLKRAGVREGAAEIVLRAAGGYSDSIPLKTGMATETMLAVSMNGQRLPRNHGFPGRLLVPGLYGMENVKWLTGVEVIRGHYLGYWQQRGWAKVAVVHTMSKFSIPRDGEIFPPGQTTQVGGVAFSGNRGIRKVEIAIGLPSHPDPKEMQWLPADLLPGASATTWTEWRYLWLPDKPGDYLLQVRATDDRGVQQTAEQTSTFPDGATGYDAVSVSVSRS